MATNIWGTDQDHRAFPVSFQSIIFEDDSNNADGADDDDNYDADERWGEMRLSSELLVIKSGRVQIIQLTKGVGDGNGDDGDYGDDDDGDGEGDVDNDAG